MDVELSKMWKSFSFLSCTFYTAYAIKKLEHLRFGVRSDKNIHIPLEWTFSNVVFLACFC